jgi:hypothetical protein
MKFNLFTKMFPNSQLVTLNPPRPDGVLVEPFKVDRISDVDPRVAVHVRLADKVRIEFHDKYGNARSYDMPNGSLLVAPLILRSEKPALKQLRESAIKSLNSRKVDTLVTPAPVAPPPPPAPVATANPILTPADSGAGTGLMSGDVERAKTLLLDIARISKDVRNGVDVSRNQVKLRKARADFNKFPAGVRDTAKEEARALARRNRPLIDEMNATLGGSRRTRKNPVRFVRDHAPHVGPKDLKKLRTLSKRHNLMIPMQTTETSWKTFDPAGPPKKVVRVVVDGTHTFEFGLDGKK